MFEIKWEGIENLTKKFETYNRQLEELRKHQVAEQLVEWQRIDMRRQYPNIKTDETNQSIEATTEIWPRSRLEQEPGFRRPKRPVVKKGPTLARPKGMGRQPASMRSILRNELFLKLIDRMSKIVTEAMKWP
jgi:hypothetical protein